MGRLSSDLTETEKLLHLAERLSELTDGPYDWRAKHHIAARFVQELYHLDRIQKEDESGTIIWDPGAEDAKKHKCLIPRISENNHLWIGTIWQCNECSMYWRLRSDDGHRIWRTVSNRKTARLLRRRGVTK